MNGLETSGLSVWLPGRGTVLRGVDLALPQGSLTLLVGRNATGATSLLTALAGRLPLGAVSRGESAVEHRNTTGLTAAELAGAVRYHGDRPLLELPVRQLTGGVDDRLLADLGLAGVLERTPGSLGRQAQAAVRIAHALAGRGCRLLLLDQVLGNLAPDHRPIAARAVADAAAKGTTVLWADHFIEHALGVADLVLEALPGGEFRLEAADHWSPRTVPAPPLLALGRALGLPRERWLDAAAIARQPAVRSALPGAGGSRRISGDTVAVIDGGQVGLDGGELAVRYGEPLGIVTARPGDGRDLLVARRLLRRLRPPALPAGTAIGQTGATVAAVCRAWERRHRLPPGSVDEQVRELAELRPAAALNQHSAGERTALSWALDSARTGPRLLVEPTLGFDPAARRAAAERLVQDAASVTLVVSSDIEFLVRGCARILVVDGDRVAGDGAPAAVLSQLPALPQVAQVCAPRPVSRVRDCLGGRDRGEAA